VKLREWLRSLPLELAKAGITSAMLNNLGTTFKDVITVTFMRTAKKMKECESSSGRKHGSKILPTRSGNHPPELPKTSPRAPQSVPGGRQSSQQGAQSGQRASEGLFGLNVGSLLIFRGEPNSG